MLKKCSHSFSLCKLFNQKYIPSLRLSSKYQFFTRYFYCQNILWNPFPIESYNQICQIMQSYNEVQQKPFVCMYVFVTQSFPTLCDPMDYIAFQAPLSLEFSRKEYWSGLPFPSPGDLPNPRNNGPNPPLVILFRYLKMNVDFKLVVAHMVKNLPAIWETWVWSLG